MSNQEEKEVECDCNGCECGNGCDEDCSDTDNICECDRCDECDEITDNCECEYCDDCTELVDNCDCSKAEKFTLEIDLTNDDPNHFEGLARLLEQVAGVLRRKGWDKLEADTGPIFDTNGNSVGEWEIE